MNYEQDNERRRLWAILGVALYAVMFVGLMFVTYTVNLPRPSTGILIDLQVGEMMGGGGGGGSRPLGRPDNRPATMPSRAVQAEPVIASENSTSAIEVPIESDKPAQTTTPVQETVPAREVDRRALFPGRNEGNASSTQGTADGAAAGGGTGTGGGRGSGMGTGTGSGSGSGSGSGTGSGSGSGNGSGVGSGSGFSLSGRYLIGQLPRPAYNADVEGRVVIRITVDRDGKVTTATYEQEGSTTNHGDLVAEARKAAMNARFTASDADLQTGTITYIFRLD